MTPGLTFLALEVADVYCTRMNVLFFIGFHFHAGFCMAARDLVVFLMRTIGSTTFSFAVRWQLPFTSFHINGILVTIFVYTTAQRCRWHVNNGTVT